VVLKCYLSPPWALSKGYHMSQNVTFNRQLRHVEYIPLISGTSAGFCQTALITIALLHQIKLDCFPNATKIYLANNNYSSKIAFEVMLHTSTTSYLDSIWVSYLQPMALIRQTLPGYISTIWWLGVSKKLSLSSGDRFPNPEYLYIVYCLLENICCEITTYLCVLELAEV